jgi:hypothetical protein
MALGISIYRDGIPDDRMVHLATDAIAAQSLLDSGNAMSGALEANHRTVLTGRLGCVDCGHSFAASDDDNIVPLTDVATNREDDSGLVFWHVIDVVGSQEGRDKAVPPPPIP